MNKQIQLTPEQINEIANSTMAIIPTAKLYGIGKGRVVQIRKIAGTNLGRGNGERLNGYKLLKDERIEIGKSILPYKELAIKYNVSESTIAKIRRKAGNAPGRGKNNEGGNYKLTREQTEYVIKSVHLSGVILSQELKVSPSCISAIRRRNGVIMNKVKTKEAQPK